MPGLRVRRDDISQCQLVEGESRRGDLAAGEAQLPIERFALSAALDVTSEGCDYEYVEVTVPPGGAQLRAEIAPIDPVADLDLYVRDPDGRSIGSSIVHTSTSETVSAHVDRSGLYTVRVVPYNIYEGTFSGNVALQSAED